MKINVELILECLNELQSTTIAKQKYADYYNGQHAILKNYAMQENRSNQKLIFNFPKGITYTDEFKQLFITSNQQESCPWTFLSPVGLKCRSLE